MTIALRFSSFAFLAPSLALVAGCSGPAAEDAVETVAQAHEIASNCSFIPGCLSLVEARARPFVASVMRFDDGRGNGVRERLVVTYLEDISSSFLPCTDFRQRRVVNFVFVFGAPEARRSLTREATVHCVNSYGDGQREPHRATLVIDKASDPGTWDTLFPPAADGSRWFALEVAASNDRGAWDSRYGANYPLVFVPR
ncbi:MAG: hypothetical protein U0169_05310 [Polyangiaceae bacterium]